MKKSLIRDLRNEAIVLTLNRGIAIYFIIKEETFIVETVMEIRGSKSKKEYKVKWLHYSDTDATWEPADNIPGFIRKVSKYNTKIQGNSLKWFSLCQGKSVNVESAACYTIYTIFIRDSRKMSNISIPL